MIYLGCHGLNKLTDVGIGAVSAGCTTLQTLDISFATKITDASLEGMGKSLTVLRFLSVRSCVKITDDGIKALSDGCSDLELLDCSLCSKLRDVSVEILEERENKLLNFSFKGCVWLSQQDKYCSLIELPRLEFKEAKVTNNEEDIDHKIMVQQAQRNSSPNKDAAESNENHECNYENEEGEKFKKSPSEKSGELRPATVSKTMRSEALVDPRHQSC